MNDFVADPLLDVEWAMEVEKCVNETTGLLLSHINETLKEGRTDPSSIRLIAATFACSEKATSDLFKCKRSWQALKKAEEGEELEEEESKLLSLVRLKARRQRDLAREGELFSTRNDALRRIIERVKDGKALEGWMVSTINALLTYLGEQEISDLFAFELGQRIETLSPIQTVDEKHTPFIRDLAGVIGLLEPTDFESLHAAYVEKKGVDKEKDLDFNTQLERIEQEAAAFEESVTEVDAMIRLLSADPRLRTSALLDALVDARDFDRPFAFKVEQDSGRLEVVKGEG